ncbi:MAG: hypothetical protein LC772_12185, partial [Chloroflexi bacterium]|nr:hypothetical protein [Chloroflexota bacterium]
MYIPVTPTLMLAPSILCLAALFALAVPARAASTGNPARASRKDHPPSKGFKKLATAYGLGGVLNSIVGPGPTPGSQRLYLSYIYAENTVDLVSVDPATGGFHVFESPVRSEWGAWALAAGPDGNIYVGTLPGAHLFRLNPRTGEYIDLGRPAPTEQYIWQLTVGSDHRLYGCTYPSARLVRFDPATGKAEDLGRMDETEQYARFVAASDDGFVYTGIGMGRSHLAAYEIATGQHRDILPAEFEKTGSAEVHRAVSGKVYGSSAGQHFRLDGWNAVAIPAGEDPGAAPRDRLSDGASVSIVDSQIEVSAAGGSAASRFPYGYAGRALPIFRLGAGPDGLLYASSILPIHFLQFHPRTGAVKELGGLGGGEFYSLLARGDRLLMAAYSGKAPLMSYDPGAAFEPGAGKGANPALVNYPGQDGAWRPQAMINGPDGKVYLGAVAGYGKLGGPLAVWDT